ncbi:MAG: glycosyltransferase family 4 protein [Anaerolineales bacterium]|nr:glycosyltransferase family 4 protein [Anaerolineales bacterium]
MRISADRTDDRYFFTTVGGWGDERFLNRARPIPFSKKLDKIPRTKFYPLAEFALFQRVLLAALRHDVLLLFSSRGYLKPELLATAVIGLLPRFLRPRIIFYGEMFEPNSGLRRWLERGLMRLANRGVFRFALHSHAEILVFAQTWHIDPAKIRATGFFNKHAKPDTVIPHQQRERHIFAGGTSFRNYEPLIAAARLMPNTDFVICTNRLDDRTDLPPNVRAGLVSPDEYDRLIATAAAVVVPLQQDVHRITGMLTYLQAMWMKKPVIVSDTLGAREYIDAQTGLIVDGSPESYVDAIRFVTDPAQTAVIDAMCQRAHDTVLDQFTVAHHVDKLLAVVDEAFADW